ncbi:alkaline phosphatase [Belnapia sp. T18]|uniref:Alkaline phosphatase n=1 Tax=Belnapia arida TaxID=2804533 RepID=A0ABS1U7Y4_9PROT|nr:alkaline phosphatase [Belnapia arida]MBL6080792.1 alkaline phosphatase [Belnapia arida]
MADMESGTSQPVGDDAASGSGPIKNIIVMVADGGGFNTLEATRQYLGDARGGPVGELAIDGDGFVEVAQSVYPLDTRSEPLPAPAGLLQNPATVYSPEQNYDFTPVEGENADGFTRGFDGYDWNRGTAPDSANTMTSMMTGVKTYNNAVNVDGAGDPLLTLAEAANAEGKATGVVSTVQFSDATPAAGGGAHNVARSNRTEIAEEMFKAGVLDVIGGTGNPDYDDDGQPVAEARYDWVGEDVWTALKDGTFRSDDGSSWELLQDRADIQAAGSGDPTDDRLAMIAQAFTGTNFYRADGDPENEKPYDVPRLESSPTLTELSQAALNKLGTDDDGFYLTIEGGGVDRAMHGNNFGRMIEEYVDFDAAVKSTIDWVNSEESAATFEDTLLIVTADHDHLLFGPEGETIPYQRVQEDRDGDGVPEYQWFGDSHSNQLVPLYAFGAGAEGVAALADQKDAVLDADGNRVAGSGRDYTDQAELGAYLLDQVGEDGTDEPVAPQEPVDWNALAAQVLANYEATGNWYL